MLFPQLTIASKIISHIAQSGTEYRESKAVSLYDRTDPQVSRRMKIPEFIDHWHIKVARLSAVLAGQNYPLGNTPSGKEPVSFRIAAQCLN
jgi:hypothetical protein